MAECRYTNCRKGVVTVWTLLTFLVLLMFVGLALDTARVLLVAHQLQNAADASALAGAAYVRTDASAARLQAIAVATANTAEGRPVAVADNPDNDPAGDIVIGRFDRATGVFSPTLTAPNAVKVVAHRTGADSLPLIFGPILGVSTSNVSRYAIAMIGGGTGAGIIALDPDDPKSLYVNGTVTLTVDGGAVQVNSSDDGAVRGSGSTSEIIAPVINVTGDANLQNTIFTGELNPGAPVIPDPLRDLPPPSFTSPSFPGVNIRQNDTAQTLTLTPGYYADGITMNNPGSTVRLSPGTYILDGTKTSGGLQINGGTFIAENCTLYIKGGLFDLGGNANITITPPESGIYEYLSVWNATTATGRIRGGDQSQIEGTLYNPAGPLICIGTGDAFELNQLIARTIEVQGNGTVTIHYEGKEPAVGTRVFLVK